MKFMKSMLSVICMLFAAQSLVAGQQAAEQKAQQAQANKTAMQNKVASARATIAAKKSAAQVPAKPTTAPTKPSKGSGSSSGDSQELQAAVQKFTQAMAVITCSCGSQKGKDGQLDKEALPRCKHDKDHQNKLNKAFEAYKELHKLAMEQKITEKLNQEVKPAVKKLFQCKNIKKMAWTPKNKNQGSKNSTASSGSTTNSTTAAKS